LSVEILTANAAPSTLGQAKRHAPPVKSYGENRKKTQKIAEAESFGNSQAKVATFPKSTASPPSPCGRSFGANKVGGSVAYRIEFQRNRILCA
jgi:hypothetical protein